MLTLKQFDERVTDLWNSQKRMAAERKWKSGTRCGTVRTPAQPIGFDKQALRAWLWKRVGLNAITCPYCGAAIDILSLTLDHIQPRSIGGEFTLENTEPICHDCNHRKGNMTHEAFTALLQWARAQLSPYDQGVLLARLKAAHSGSANRFFRDKSRRENPHPTRQPAGRTAQPQTQLDWF